MLWKKGFGKCVESDTGENVEGGVYRVWGNFEDRLERMLREFRESVGGYWTESGNIVEGVWR